MNPEAIIDIFSKACEKAGVKWYLYFKSLLVADVYNEFPEGYENVQLAVEAANIRKIARHLPSDWERKNNKYYKDNRVILTVFCIEEPQSITFIKVNDKDYPVMEDYNSYLTETFGDISLGLTDEMGFGFTEESKAEHKEHQKNCLEALTFIQKLAKEHNLRYYLVAGSVLGAVRHKGFIPWDDDIDIGIRVENINEFERLVKENLPSKFTLMQPAPNNPYNRMFAKICYNGRCCIDIWRLCPTKKSGIIAKIKWVSGRMLTKCHYTHIKAHVGKYEKLARFICFFLNDKAIMRIARFVEAFPKKNADSYINLYSIYSRHKETIDINWLNTETYETFEGIEVPVIGRTDEYLTHLYGNYMELPPRWNRVTIHTSRF